MNIVLFSEDELLDDNSVLLCQRRSEHILSVIKATPGKRLKAGIINGLLGYAEVIDIVNNLVKIRFFAEKAPPSPLAVELIIALQRPKTLKKIIQSTVAAGVKKITFIESWKVDKSYWQSPLLSDNKLYEQMIIGLEQGGDSVLPDIEFKRRFKAFC